MKKVLSSVIAVVVAMSFSSAVFAAGSDVIDLQTPMGKIIFQHKLHQERLKGCTKCHTTPAGGKIVGFGKEFAHRTCKGCHIEMGKGPTSCKVCHQK